MVGARVFAWHAELKTVSKSGLNKIALESQDSREKKADELYLAAQPQQIDVLRAPMMSAQVTGTIIARTETVWLGWEILRARFNNALCSVSSALWSLKCVCSAYLCHTRR